MKKLLLPLGIAIAGILICVGLLFWDYQKLQKENDDLLNGKEPEPEPDKKEEEIEIIKDNGQSESTPAV